MNEQYLWSDFLFTTFVKGIKSFIEYYWKQAKIRFKVLGSLKKTWWIKPKKSNDFVRPRKSRPNLKRNKSFETINNDETTVILTSIEKIAVSEVFT